MVKSGCWPLGIGLPIRSQYEIESNTVPENFIVLFLCFMGIEVELSGSVERMITLTPGTGTDYLRW